MRRVPWRLFTRGVKARMRHATPELQRGTRRRSSPGSGAAAIGKAE